jgi:flagellar motor switch protein FliN/FliY
MSESTAEFPPEGGGDAEQDAMAAEWAAALEQQASTPAAGESSAAASEVTDAAPQMTPAAFANFAPTPTSAAGNDINMILDIPVQLTVVELDAMAGEPMDVLVNGFLIAQGEVVVVNDKFGIRLTDIVTPSERMRRLSRGC